MLKLNGVWLYLVSTKDYDHLLSMLSKTIYLKRYNKSDKNKSSFCGQAQTDTYDASIDQFLTATITTALNDGRYT